MFATMPYRLSVTHYTPDYTDQRITVRYYATEREANDAGATYSEHPRTISAELHKITGEVAELVNAFDGMYA